MINYFAIIYEAGFRVSGRPLTLEEIRIAFEAGYDAAMEQKRRNKKSKKGIKR